MKQLFAGMYAAITAIVIVWAIIVCSVTVATWPGIRSATMETQLRAAAIVVATPGISVCAHFLFRRVRVPIAVAALALQLLCLFWP